MELRQLRYVVAVAEEGTFTAAAARVHVAQPAISQQIARLEAELGTPLFDRSDRRVRLTSAGEAFVSHARAALAATTAAADVVGTMLGELSGDLHLGTIPSPPDWLLEQVGAYAERHPKVRLRVMTNDPETLTSSVTTGALDLALIGTSGGRLPAGPAGQRLRSILGSRTVATEPLVVLVPEQHRLAGADGTTLRALRDEDMVTLVPGRGLRSVLDAACAEAGFTPRVAVETNDLHLLATLVARGAGIAVTPRSTALRTSERVHVLRLRSPRLNRRMALVWHRQALTGPGRAFLELAGVRDTA